MNESSISVFTLSDAERKYADQAVGWYLEQMEGAACVTYQHAINIERRYTVRLRDRLLYFIFANRAEGNDTTVYCTLFDRLAAWDRAYVANRRDELEALR